MKKLLVLVLVLGMASLANAGILSDISLSMSGSTVTVNGLAATTAYFANGFGIYVPGGAASPVISNVAIGSAAGDLGKVLWYGNSTDYAGYNGFDAFPGQSGQGANVAIGTWATFTYAGAVGDKLDIFDNAISATQRVGQLTITPEPATLAILGLGALLLRRKK